MRRLPSNSSEFSCAYTAMCLQCTGSLRRALQIVYVWTKYSKLSGWKNQTMFGPFETTTYLWCCLASNARHEQHIFRPYVNALVFAVFYMKKNRYILRPFWTRFSQFFRPFIHPLKNGRVFVCFCIFGYCKKNAGESYGRKRPQHVVDITFWKRLTCWLIWSDGSRNARMLRCNMHMIAYDRIWYYGLIWWPDLIWFDLLRLYTDACTFCVPSPTRTGPSIAKAYKRGTIESTFVAAPLW